MLGFGILMDGNRMDGKRIDGNLFLRFAILFPQIVEAPEEGVHLLRLLPPGNDLPK